MRFAMARRRRRSITNAHGSNSSNNDFAIGPVPVADQIARGLFPAARLRDLICHPFCGRMRVRMKEIFVRAIFLCGEVVPNETLYRLVESAHRLFTRRIRHNRRETLEAVHEVALTFFDVASFDRKTTQPVGIRILCIDAERHGINTAHSVDLITPDFFDLNRIRLSRFNTVDWPAVCTENLSELMT